MKNFGFNGKKISRYENSQNERKERLRVFSVAATLTFILGTFFAGGYKEVASFPDNLTMASLPNSENTAEQISVMRSFSINYSEGVPTVKN